MIDKFKAIVATVVMFFMYSAPRLAIRVPLLFTGAAHGSLLWLSGAMLATAKIVAKPHYWLQEALIRSLEAEGEMLEEAIAIRERELADEKRENDLLKLEIKRRSADPEK
jgi:hypothetical protein